MTHDSKADTFEHIRTVQLFIGKVIRRLLDRADEHDFTKLLPPEKETFDRMTPRLSSVSYGSDEYRAMLKEIRPALDHHNRYNSHHPEFYENGIGDMDLVDLVEMFCDWKAASMRHADGDLRKSLSINAERFGIDEQLCSILANTIKRMRW